MKTFATVVLLSVGLASLPAAENAWPAQTNAVVITTDYIDQLVAEARTNNPALKAAAARVRSATLNAAAVRTWDDPLANISGSLYSQRGFKSSEEGDLAYGIQQNLPLWGLPRLNREVANAQASTLSAEEAYRVQQIRRDLTKALLDNALAEQVVEFGEQDIAWLDTTAKAVESKYRAGNATVADTLQIQNEVAESQDTLVTDRHELEHEHVGLDRLLNRSVSGAWPSLQLPESIPPVPFSEKLVSLALANEPRLKALAEEIRQAEAKAALTKRSRLPVVGLGIEGWQYSGDGEFRSGTFTVNFTLPWLNEGKYHRDYQRDQELLNAAQEERNDQRLMVREELHHFTVDIEALRREALLYQNEISARAAQALSSRSADWEAGRGTLRDVLDARRMLLDSQLKAARAIASQRQAVAQLLFIAGVENVESLEPLMKEPSLISDHATHGK